MRAAAVAMAALRRRRGCTDDDGVEVIAREQVLGALTEGGARQPGSARTGGCIRIRGGDKNSIPQVAERS
jgi:hypothetical protein